MKTVYWKSHILGREVRTEALSNHCLINFSHVANWLL